MTPKSLSRKSPKTQEYTSIHSISHQCDDVMGPLKHRFAYGLAPETPPESYRDIIKFNMLGFPCILCEHVHMFVYVCVWVSIHIILFGLNNNLMSYKREILSHCKYKEIESFREEMNCLRSHTSK